jgi:GTPase SAR1 family protein
MKLENEKKTFKITFLGMSGSGKTCIINRLVNNSFNPVYDPTLLKKYIITYLLNL